MRKTEIIVSTISRPERRPSSFLSQNIFTQKKNKKILFVENNHERFVCYFFSGHRVPSSTFRPGRGGGEICYYFHRRFGNSMGKIRNRRGSIEILIIFVYLLGKRDAVNIMNHILVRDGGTARRRDRALRNTYDCVQLDADTVIHSAVILVPAPTAERKRKTARNRTGPDLDDNIHHANGTGDSLIIFRSSCMQCPRDAG